MAVEFKAKESYKGTFQRFWRGEAKILPAGYKLLNTISNGVKLLRAVLVQIFPDDLTAAVVKYGTVITGGTTTKIRVSKENYFEVGDFVQVIDGSVAKQITAVDHSNEEYDVITVNAALTGVEAGNYLVESDNASGEGQTPSAKYTPNNVLGAEKTIDDKIDFPTLDVAYDAVVIKDVIPPVPAAWLTDTGLCLKENHSIKFIKQ